MDFGSVARTVFPWLASVSERLFRLQALPNQDTATMKMEMGLVNWAAILKKMIIKIMQMGLPMKTTVLLQLTNL